MMIRAAPVTIRAVEATPEEFTHLLEALPYFNQCHDPDWAFEFALDLIVGGLERMLEEARWQREESPFFITDEDTRTAPGV